MDIIRAPGNINFSSNDSGGSLELLLRSPKSKDNNGGHHHGSDDQHLAAGGRNGLKASTSSASGIGMPPEQRASNTRGGDGGGGPQLRQTPNQCSSTDSGNSSSVSSSSSSSNGAGGSNSVSASGVSVDDPETKNAPTDPIGDQSAIKRNVYVNKTYDGEARPGGGDGARVPRSVGHSIDEGIDHEEEQKQLAGTPTVHDLEQHQEGEEIKPLLEIAHERFPSKKTKSIVKSPSNQSFGEKAPRTLSLQFSQPESVIVADRPVHHVQFSSKQRTESDSDGCERATLLAGGTVSAGLPMDPMCPASPVGSILSHGSGSSSESGSSSSSSSNGNSSLEAYAEARPPDGGWGWVVCFASFMVNLIADGVTFSFGVMYIELLSYFGEGKGKTAWVGSLFMAMPLLCGPVASFLTDRYGCRKVTIIGSILASVGFALSAYATSIEMLYLTFGILAGFGLSLCYVAAVVIVAYYFDKKRSFATGLSVCGSGIGTFIFASLTQVLLDEYGWRGTTLILAGVFLNMCLCGLLMRDLEWTTHKSKQRRRKQQQQQQQQQQADSVSNSTNTAGNASVIEPGGGGVGLVGATGATMAETMNEQYDLDDPRLFSSLITLPTFLQNGGSHEKIPLELLTMLSKQRNVHDHHLLQSLPPKVSSSHSFSQPLSPQSGDDLEVHNEEPVEGDADDEQEQNGGDQQQGAEGTEVTETSTKPANGTTINDGTVRASRQRDAGGQRTGARGWNVVGQKQSAAAQYEHEQAQLPVFLRRVHSHSTRGTAPAIGATSVAQPQGTTASYLKDLRMHRHSLTYRGAMLNIQRYRLRASSCPDIYRNSMTTIAKEKSAWFQGVEEFRTLLVSILDFSYFSDVHYLLFAVSNFLLYTFYDVPYVYLGDYATQLGFSSQSSSMLISIIGILNMVGEVVLGWMGDRKSVNANYTYAICMGLCGVVTALVPLFKDLTSLSALAGGFGLFIAANYSLTSIILVELISLERFTNAYGLLLLVQGVANLVGPPLAGWISDLTESYDLSFYLAGFFIVISGALLMILPVLTKVRKTMEAQRRRSSARTTADVDNEGAHLDKKHCNNNISSQPVTLDLKSTFIANGKGTTPNGISKGVSYAEHVVGVDSKNQPFKGGVTV